MPMGSRLPLIAVAAGALVLVLGATLAAGARLKTSTDTRTVGEQETAETSAKCKGTGKPVSGGFENEFIPEKVVGGGSPQPFQHGSLREGKRWVGRTFNLGPPGKVTTYAYCRAGKLKANSKSTTVEGTPFMSSDYGTGSATAKCPRGTKAVSGGFDTPDFVVTGDYENDSRITPYASRRQGGRKWTVEAANYAGAEGTLVASVYCREGHALDKKKKTVTVEGDPATGVVGEAVAKCPKGTRVVSGGFDLGGAEGDLLASRKRGGRKWLASASVGFPLTRELTTFAYCEQK